MSPTASPPKTASPQKTVGPQQYLTTPIYYVNDHPHIGHIYSTLLTDTVARYRRMNGDAVYFLTGTDEHGQKIEKAAEARGIEPIALADEVVETYHRLWADLELTHDDFIRTSEPRHHAGVAEIIRRIEANGDFYVDSHSGWYCYRCETFYTEKELIDAPDSDDKLCPDHETPCEWKEESNVFFRLSAYQDRLLELYSENPNFVRPATRLNEVRNFVEQGLKDLSVSRTSVKWAVDFPGYEGHTVYVWLDALTNYITALGFGSDDTSSYDRIWRDGDHRTHVIGKDILRFHAIYWPAFLMSAGLPLPDTVWAHGWWLRDDKKLSKSSGNIVRPDHLLQDFGHDALRFYLLRDMAFGQDASFSDEAFIDRYNTDLANDLGNTVSRLVTLSRRAFDDHLPPTPGDALRQAAELAVSDFRRHMDEWAFHDALRALWKLLQEVSQYLVANEPWKKLKDETQLGEVSKVLWTALEAVRIVASALLPVLPNKAPAVLRSIGASVNDDLTKALDWGQLPTGEPLGAVEPLFPRIDKKDYLSKYETTDAVTAGAKGKNMDKPTAAAADKTTDAKVETKTEAPAAPEVAARDQDAKISIDHFFDVELRVAKVVAAEPVKKSNKLLKLTVDVGEESTRTVVAGIAKAYTAEDLVDQQVIVVANLKPAKLMGIESNGMVLAATEDGLPVLVRPSKDVPVGTRVR